jgi:hypothetical protein
MNGVAVSVASGQWLVAVARGSSRAVGEPRFLEFGVRSSELGVWGSVF